MSVSSSVRSNKTTSVQEAVAVLRLHGVQARYGNFIGGNWVGRRIMKYAAQNLIPMTLELGGKSPNIFFADVMDAYDEFFDKALEGFALFAFNKGEVCTCPSRALIQESIFDEFLERAVERIAKI